MRLGELGRAAGEATYPPIGPIRETIINRSRTTGKVESDTSFVEDLNLSPI